MIIVWIELKTVNQNGNLEISMKCFQGYKIVILNETKREAA